MKTHVLPLWAYPCFFRLIALLLVLDVLPVMGAENPKKSREPPPLFTWDLLWTGSWYKSVKRAESGFPAPEDILPDGTLFNRGDLSLALPRQDLLFRFMATDKRVLPLDEEDAKAGFNPGMGMYQRGSGSRFLLGVQSEYGLPARINHVWLRSVPFMEYRSPSSRDLKTEPAAQDKSESYLYLALPGDLLPGFGAFASAALDSELNPAFGTGLGLGGGATELRLEGFYTRKELAPRKASSWFSSAPPLPERDFSIYALGLIFNSPFAAFASDWAWSETFAWGRGLYGNFALQLGNKPWRFSLAGDGAGTRFADRNGATAGAGFRIAAKAERFWLRSGFFRFQSVFRSAAIDEPFDRGSFSLYFRPSAPSAAARRNPLLFRFSRASLDLNRDARIPEKTDDSLKALFGFYFGPLSGELYGTLSSLSALSTLDGKEGNPPLFQPRFFESFDSFKVSGELGLKPGIFDIRTRLGYTIRAEKAPLWELSFNCAVRPAKWNRLSLNAASTDFPEKWNYTFSWRFTMNGEFRDQGSGTRE